MGFIAGAGALIGGLASAYSASQSGKTTSLPAQNYNAYGEVNTPDSGAITSRNNIFGTLNAGTLNNQAAGASQNYANALNSAATSPGLSAAGNLATNEINGSYLNSPTVNNYANQAYNSIIGQGANQNARIQANFANNGIGFSTGMQQAQQANSAATSNQAALARSGILSQNYQAERQLQQGAIGQEESVVAQPSTYLSQINSALYSPYASQASLTTGLLGNSVQSPQNTYVAQPGLGQAIGSGVSTAQGLYSLLNGVGKSSGAGSAGSDGVATGGNANGYYGDADL